MKVSTTTSRIAKRFDDFTSIKVIADAGFDAIDYSMFCMNDYEREVPDGQIRAAIERVGYTVKEIR